MSSPIDPELARTAVKTIKFLAVDAVEKAKSGHPGMPMGAAGMAFVLWSRFLRYDPTAPDWPDRDRFLLSAGHGSMLQYALLHLAGYDLPVSELQAFRQWESRTPGHPEFGLTPGIEATTGPLGQGVGNAVGLALSAKLLAARFGTPEFQPITHRVFAIAGDGDMQEGISGEASSLVGHIGLGNLVVLYDDNHISIEGNTSLSFSEDVPLRYEAYGWHVQRCDGHDLDAVTKCLEAAIEETGKPSLISCRTHIGHGAPNKQDTHEAHGAPLGPDETKATKEALGWPLEPAFLVPDAVRAFFQARAHEGAALRTGWESRIAQWRHAYPDKSREWDAIVNREVPVDVVERLVAEAPDKAAATREHGRDVLQHAVRLIPGLIGGSADLAPSTLTLVKGAASVTRESFAGRNLHFGIREHAMGAVMNGMAYSGAFIPYGSTFLVFADYMRPAIRLAALSHLQAIYVFTHDSIFVGEDGPTHEPIEHVASLRIIPNLHVVRPADGWETAVAWGHALRRRHGPTAILLTRQKLPPIARELAGVSDALRGAYLVRGAADPHAVVVATGSEVHLAVAASEALAGEGIRLNVVSAPCLELFEDQDEEYRSSLLPEGVPVATIEAGRTDPWRAIAGAGGLTIGIDRFGASAPGNVLGEKFGFTAPAVTEKLRSWLKR